MNQPSTPTASTAEPHPTPEQAPRWTAVVFDLDGTLVNTLELIVSAFQHAHDRVAGEQIDPEVAKSWMGRSLLDIFGDGPRAEALLNAYQEFNKANLETLQSSYEGVADLLRDLSAAGVKVGVVTSKEREDAVRSVRAGGLTGLVELTTTLEETVLHKPHPDPIHHARRKLDAHDEPCVYVGDAIWDVRAAAAAGIDQIAVGWGASSSESLRAENPSHGVVETVTELRSLLLG
ncbi:HAD-IA family hydrolase [Tessaracoccus sp. SD287]|uniref:HAD family hydrolase n=1 Tax=Tessaracoccus sp. SD287 TaxID=2782008 RepID=UPI001A967F0F|nr:HAD-IA family hydrolase [Tessaracoccus sp. SD287]